MTESTAKPKTKSRTVIGKDLGKAFQEERQPFGVIRYRRPARGRNWRYTGPDKELVFGPDEQSIQGEFNGRQLSREEMNEFLAWVKQNCIWHSTAAFVGSSTVSLKGTKTDLPELSFKFHVQSTVLRRLTDEMKLDLSEINLAKEERVAKEKAEAKKRRAEQAKERAAKKKAAQRAAKDSEFSDLATALKVLKNHGLKVVTVEERGKKK